MPTCHVFTLTQVKHLLQKNLKNKNTNHHRGLRTRVGKRGRTRRPVQLVKESVAGARRAREPQAAQAVAYADPGNLAITLDVPRLQTLWDGDDAIQKLIPDL